MILESETKLNIANHNNLPSSKSAIISSTQVIIVPFVIEIPFIASIQLEVYHLSIWFKMRNIPNVALMILFIVRDAFGQ